MVADAETIRIVAITWPARRVTHTCINATRTPDGRQSSARQHTATRRNWLKAETRKTPTQTSNTPQQGGSCENQPDTLASGHRARRRWIPLHRPRDAGQQRQVLPRPSKRSLWNPPWCRDWIRRRGEIPRQAKTAGVGWKRKLQMKNCQSCGHPCDKPPTINSNASTNVLHWNG